MGQYLFAGAFPVLPGKSDRVKNFGQELAAAGHAAEWDRLSRETSYTRYNIFLQPGPEGDVAIYAFEFDDPTKPRLQFTESPFDRWWVSFFEDVHGIDLSAVPPENMTPPPLIYSWDDGSSH